MLLAVVAVAVVVVAVSLGAAHATADAASTAARLAADGQYAASIALDTTISTRTGPLYVLDRGDVAEAQLNAQRTMLTWAAALDRQGKVDQAVAMAGTVTDPRLAATANQERAALLLEAAKAAASRGDYSAALARLGQVTTLRLNGASQVATQVAQLQPQYEVGAAHALAVSGDGVDAVALLDSAAHGGGQAAAGAEYPHALLVAGMQEMRQLSFKEAATTLQRLVSTYAGTAEARQASTLLRAGQPVSGTLVDKSGHALSGQVRLSSHYFTEPGGYLTTGPFYYSRADSDGNFRFDSVPQGGPYVFEVFHGGNWTTFVDPNTNQPAEPVTITPLAPVDLSFITVP
ncbi:MAG: carboxypeptidase-like regulatory domain-containing protein [Candidatus Dormibacteria bacterium]